MMATAIHLPEVTFDSPILPSTPSGLADVLDQMAQPFIGRDVEIATALCTAREALRAIAWNRYAARKTRESARRARVRRLSAHAAAWRARR